MTKEDNAAYISYIFTGYIIWFLGLIGMPFLAVKYIYKPDMWPAAAIVIVSDMLIMLYVMRHRLWPWPFRQAS